VRPVLDVHAEELEHPRHGKRVVGQVGERRAVAYRDVVVAGLRQLLLQHVPLLEGVGVKPCKMSKSATGRGLESTSSAGLLLNSPRQLDWVRPGGVPAQKVEPVLGGSPVTGLAMPTAERVASERVADTPYSGSLVLGPRHDGGLLRRRPAGPIAILVEPLGEVLDARGALKDDGVFPGDRVAVANGWHITLGVNGVVPLAVRVNDGENMWGV